MSKHLPMFVHPDRMREVIGEAIDIIAGFSTMNAGWKPILEAMRAPPTAAKKGATSGGGGGK